MCCVVLCWLVVLCAFRERCFALFRVLTTGCPAMLEWCALSDDDDADDAFYLPFGGLDFQVWCCIVIGER